MGPYTLVDLHMQVDPLLSVSGAHQAEARVRRIIKARVWRVQFADPPAWFVWVLIGAHVHGN